MDDAYDATNETPSLVQPGTGRSGATLPNVSPAREALVKRWLKDIEATKEHFKKDFQQMREDMFLAAHGDDESWVNDGKYTVPVVMRHINVSVGALYARNPQPEAQFKKRLRYKLWDGTLESINEAVANPLAPGSLALLQEIDSVKKTEFMLKRIGKTLEALFQHYTGVGNPEFRSSMKQLIRRAKVCGVAYVWLDFQRELGKRPEVMAQIEDVTKKLEQIEADSIALQEGDATETDAEAERLRLNLADLKASAEMIIREGVVFDFPRADEVIIDKACRNLQTFQGARWVAREFHMEPEEIKSVYKVDIGKNFHPYGESGHTKGDIGAGDKKDLACLFVVFDRVNRQKFIIVKGYPDFIQEPAAPEFELNRFWPVHALVLNSIESEKRLYPPSDVRALRHPQQEYNSCRQGLREHRIQNRPIYATAKGSLEEQDKEVLRAPSSGAVVELGALAGVDRKIDDVIQRVKPAPIDPAVYETRSAMDDIERSVGAQEAQLGGTSGTSATEASISEQSLSKTTSSNMDDLDLFFSAVAQDFGEIALQMLDSSTVLRIVGEGAVWPVWSRKDIIDELMLTVKAGSSGKPNAAMELAKLERAIPLLLQMQGINITPLAEKYGQLLEIDSEELIAQGVPSMVAINAAMSRGLQGAAPPGAVAGSMTTASGNAPSAQGAQGATNSQNPQKNEPQGQPAFPVPDARN